MRTLAFKGASTQDLLREGRVSGGLVTLQEDGVRKILRGVTTVDEVMRMTQRTDLRY